MSKKLTIEIPADRPDILDAFNAILAAVVQPPIEPPKPKFRVVKVAPLWSIYCGARSGWFACLDEDFTNYTPDEVAQIVAALPAWLENEEWRESNA